MCKVIYVDDNGIILFKGTEKECNEWAMDNSHSLDHPIKVVSLY